MKQAILLTVFLFGFMSSQSAIIRVDFDAFGGANDGTTWANAYQFLDDALFNAVDGDEIWVAEGTYFPSYTDRDQPFIINKEVSIYGGFVGTEFIRSQRDWATNPTIISGDIDVINDLTDNIKQLIEINVSPDEEVILDGFRIRKAYNETGDIAALELVNGACHVRHCVFNNNHAVAGDDSKIIGGFTAELITLDNCLFRDNVSANDLIKTTTCDVQLIHCTIVQNEIQGQFSSLLETYLGDHEVYNTIAAGNDLVEYSFILTSGTYRNCILEDAFYNGGVDTSTLIFDLPTFVSPPNNDFNLAPGSLGIEQGDEQYGNLTLDAAHNQRKVNRQVDIGCFEYQDNAIIYVNDNAIGGNTGKNWFNAYTDLNVALDAATHENEIWIAQGLYKPDLTDRDAAFDLVSGCPIYGGFDGLETNFDERNWLINHTILSGEIGDLNDETDNSYHLLVVEPDGKDIIVDGLQLTKTYNDDATDFLTYGRSVLEMIDNGESFNLSFKNNFIHNNFSYLGSPIFVSSAGYAEFTNSYFLNNEVEDFSCAIETRSPSLIESCLFAHHSGGTSLIHAFESTTMTNCTIHGFTPSNIGTVLKAQDDPSDSHVMANCIVDLEEENNILFSLNSANYSCQNTMLFEQSDWSEQEGANNFVASPDFIDPSVNNFGLQSTSLAVNAGNNDLVSIDADIFNGERIKQGTVDLGAFETNHGDICNIEVVDIMVECYPSLDNMTLFLEISISDLVTTLPGELIINGVEFPIENNIDTYALELDDIYTGNYDLNISMSIYPCELDYQIEDLQCSILYVDLNANGNNDGSNWENAFNDLQDALDVPGRHLIWVTSGTYYTTDGFDRQTNFTNSTGSDMIGGFDGTEEVLSDRNPDNPKTILSADIGTLGDASDNSYHILQYLNSSGSSLVQGFVFDGGNAEGSFFDSYGSTIVNVGSNELLILDCVFSNNRSIGEIGNIYIPNTSVSFINCEFYENEGEESTLFTNENLGTIFESCLFYDNLVAGSNTAALISSTHYILISNCTFADNITDDIDMHQLLYCDDGGFDVVNSIFDSNDDFEYCVLEANDGSVAMRSCNVDDDVFISNGELYNQTTLDPMFVDQNANNYRLSEGSQMINTGINNFINWPYDLDGNFRINNGSADRGCYEFQTDTSPCAGDFDESGSIDAGDLLFFLSEYGCPFTCSADLTDDDQVNAEDLLIFLSVFGETCQ